MTPEQTQFADDMGQQMVGWGLPRTTGRVYGVLLLESDPITLDQLASDLQIAKSGASVAMRQLLALGLARSLGRRGSRKLLYEALYEPEAVLAARNAQMLAFVDRLRQGSRVASAGRARDRLGDMATDVEVWMDAMRELATGMRARQKAS